MFLESRIKSIRRRLRYFETHPLTTEHGIVKGSMNRFLYTECHFVVSGVSSKSKEERENAVNKLMLDLKRNERVFDFQENPYPVPERVLCLKKTQLHGNDVKWIQYHLVRLGFLPAENSNGKNNIDGIFGRATDKAVRQAQAYFGVAADGIAGDVTIYILQYN